ncbi:hypothetical protein, partial [Escherichia coli]|uniref:hypothetical protein n=1 Tax=Escherichia coli TaxID=562 RepID=UPI001AA0C7AF
INLHSIASLGGLGTCHWFTERRLQLDATESERQLPWCIRRHFFPGLRQLQRLDSELVAW